MPASQDDIAAKAPEAAAPHAPLLAYYAAPSERSGFVRDLFNRTADSYDSINRGLSLGSGAWYRRRALRQGGLRPGHRILDVAIGTGLVAREAQGIVGEAGAVVGLDLSEGMLAVARRSLPGMPLIQARAEALPLCDASMDMISMGYALRHVADLSVLFAEFRRVLRPGGRVLLLEIARPESRLGHALAKAYMGGVVPLLSRLAGARSGTLMHYYWDTIEACVAPAEIMRQLTAAGLAEVDCAVELGIFRAYMSRRPLA